jgi:hypothetical protein
MSQGRLQRSFKTCVESVGQRIRKFSPATVRYAAMKPGISSLGKERIFSRAFPPARRESQEPRKCRLLRRSA